MQFPAMFALIEHPRRGPILFDTGYSAAFLDATRRLPARIYRAVTPVTLRAEDEAVHQLAARGIRAEDVELVIASHFHGDHISALTSFPRAKVLYDETAWRAVAHLGGLGALRRGFLPALIPRDFGQRSLPIEAQRFGPLPAECAPFERGVDLIGDGSLWAVPLPGHAAGQLGLFVREERGGTVLLCADACWTSRSYREERMPHAITRLLFDDWGAYRQTLADLGRLNRARPDVAIVPSHCAEALARFGVHYDPAARTFSRR
jgi:glyoxylase-like metal-dependent hydrolase (beta-lactamase superfamily II)